MASPQRASILVLAVVIDAGLQDSDDERTTMANFSFVHAYGDTMEWRYLFAGRFPCYHLRRTWRKPLSSSVQFEI